MAYLGNVPARSFISFERQVFTIVNSQTAYTLSHSVTNENDIRLVVNNVVQEPGSGKAYTASGTTLTLSAALTNGTDEMYCVFLGRAVGTVNAPAGSVDTAQLAADAVTGAKIADDAISDEHLDPTAITGQTAEATIADDDLILISDTSASAALKKMTKANFVSGVGGDNTPAFITYKNGAQTISDATTTNVTLTETYDSDNAFASSTFTVPSGEGGKYWLGAKLMFYNTAGNLNMAIIYIKKNGNQILYSREQADSNIWYQKGINVSGLVDLAAGDAITVDVYIDHSSGTTTVSTGGEGESIFTGYKIIT